MLGLVSIVSVNLYLPLNNGHLLLSSTTGPPSPGVEIKVLDPESGLPVLPGQTGILHGEFFIYKIRAVHI